MDVGVDQLQRAVQGQHGRMAVLVDALPLIEVFQSQTEWEGVLHVFDLDPDAARVVFVHAGNGVLPACRLKAPEAELIDAKGRPFPKRYASPTWEALDGSKIVGKVLANEPAPKADAIPWLLLSAESSDRGIFRRAFRPTDQHPPAESDRRVSDGLNRAAYRVHG